MQNNGSESRASHHSEYKCSGAPLLLLAVALLILRPLNDLDLETQIALGKIQLSTFSLLTQNPLVPFGDAPFVNPGWLAQNIFAALSVLGSVVSAAAGSSAWLMELCFYLLVAFSFLLFIRVGAQTTESTTRGISFSEGMTVLLATVCAAPFLDLRPQGLSLPLLGLLLLQIEQATANDAQRQRGYRSALLLTVLAYGVLWQNLHPSVVVGVAWIGALGIAALLRRGDANTTTSLGARLRQSSIFVASAAVLAFAIILTPEGFQIAETMARNATLSREVLQITEWHTILNPALRLTVISLVIPAALYLYSLRNRRLLSEVIPVILFSFLALYGSRFALYALLAALPGIRVALANLFSSVEQSSPPRVIQYGATFITALAILAALQSPNENSIVTRTAPCLAALSSTLPPGAMVYSDRDTAGLLHQAGYRTVIDGRVYLYSEQRWHNYFAELSAAADSSPSNSAPINPAELIARYNPDGALLQLPAQAALAQILVDSGAFTPRNTSPSCAAFVSASVSVHTG